MPSHNENRQVPFTPQQMFSLVSDVARYPDFLPWCVATRIRRRDDREMIADMVIGFKGFRESFTSRVAFVNPEFIDVTYENGPFKHLTNKWNFTHSNAGCEIDFHVDFEFRSRLLEKAIGVVFDEAVQRMVDAFESRAHALYGD